MQLNITKNHKSLRSFQIELPDFTALTGLNGSGKTQIIEGIYGKKIVTDQVMRAQGVGQETGNRFIVLKEGDTQLQNVKAVDPSTLLPNESVPTTEVYRFWQEYKHAKTYPNGQSSNNPLYDDIAVKARKNVEELSENDFRDYMPIHNLSQPSDMFQRSFSVLFDTYLKRFEDNNYRKYRANYGSSVHALSDEEFQSLYEEPWILLNKILKEINTDYIIEVPNLQDYDRNSFYTFKLKNLNGDEIYIDGLSSGEKVIFSLIFALYNAQFDVTFPEVLLMDEPDASLHPSMCRQLVNVIQEVFVKQKKIKVIITTHSPSTVAVCPEDSIYVVNKAGDQIQKISKDEALKVLTSGISTLSIDYRGHKQIIVESPTDVFYYQTLHNKLVQNEKQEDILYFMSNGYGKGNCQQVIEMTTAFRRSGNQSVYGIIDWDRKERNNLDSYILTHGHGKRYSIENYVLDPIYVVCLFLEIKAHDAAKELDFDDSYNQYLIGNETNEKLQQISDWFFGKMYEKFPNYKSNNGVRNVEYYNGRMYSIPIWYLDVQGHNELLPKLKKVFPALDNPKYHAEGELQKLLTNIIGKCFPFVPLETVELLKSIN